MLEKAKTQIVVGLVVVVFAIGILLNGDQVKTDWLRYYSAAVLVVTVALAIWDRWLWRVGWFQKIRGVPSNLRGTWQGTLTSFWTDPSTGQSPAPKMVYLVVRQTSTSVSATLITDESRSRSSSGQVSGEDGDRYLVYSYLNTPDNRVEHRSRIHHGSTSLHIVGSPAKRLRGRYWTDRDSRGELEFRAVARGRMAEDYQGAQELFE